MAHEMRTTRREFLNRSFALVGASATVPVFLQQTAFAAAGAGGKSNDGRVLVVVQLAGGNDGLNTVIPYRNDRYYQLRPRLAIAAKDVLSLADGIGLHPAMTELKALYEQGLLAIVQGVGYPNPNRSHFKSTDIWETASPDGRAHEGWLGRYFDACCTGEDPRVGMALVAESPTMLRGKVFTPVAFERPEMLTFRTGGDDALADAATHLNRPDEPESKPGETTLDFLRRTALRARVSAGEIRRANRSAEGEVEFPNNPLAQSLRTVSRMIAADMPTKVYFVSLSGFDTHSNQINTHERLLGQLASSLAAFTKALGKQGILDRTLIMTFSEFGRRVAENASGGTDHGEAAPMFLLGGKVKAGIHEQMPTLEKLNRGDLAFRTDFRRVYAAVLEDWLAADSTMLLGGDFKKLEVIEARGSRGNTLGI